MNTRTRIDTATARTVLARMLTAANGGTAPDGFNLYVSSAAEPLETLYDLTDGGTRLFVEVEPDGRLLAKVGVGTSWTTIFHPNFRFARTPSGQLILLGRYQGMQMHFWIEDDRLWCDRGSPLVSVLQNAAAIEAFDVEFATLLAEAL